MLKKKVVAVLSKIILGILTIFSLSSSVGAIATGTAAYKPRVELSGKLGYSQKKSSQRHIARLGFVLPLFQKIDSHLGYLTVIGLKDTAKHAEGNIGVGYRSFVHPLWILGEYVFYDLRVTENNNLLQQVTLGVEAISQHLEIRMNGYIPTNKKFLLSNYNAYNARYDNTTNTSQLRISNESVVEQAVPGFDVEIGGSHSKFKKVELFVAYYYFKGKDVGSVKGGRLRGNLNIYHWLALEGEANYDNNRKFVSYLGMRLGWSFGGKRKGNNWSHAKMTQLPVRDIDIIHLDFVNSEKLLEENYDEKIEIFARELDKSRDKVTTSGGITITNDLTEIVNKHQKSGTTIKELVVVSNVRHGNIDVRTDGGLTVSENDIVKNSRVFSKKSGIIKANDDREARTNYYEVQKSKEERQKADQKTARLQKELDDLIASQAALKKKQQELIDKANKKTEEANKKAEEANKRAEEANKVATNKDSNKTSAKTKSKKTKSKKTKTKKKKNKPKFLTPPIPIIPNINNGLTTNPAPLPNGTKAPIPNITKAPLPNNGNKAPIPNGANKAKAPAPPPPFGNTGVKNNVNLPPKLNSGPITITLPSGAIIPAVQKKDHAGKPLNKLIRLNYKEYHNNQQKIEQQRKAIERKTKQLVESKRKQNGLITSQAYDTMILNRKVAAEKKILQEQNYLDTLKADINILKNNPNFGNKASKEKKEHDQKEKELNDYLTKKKNTEKAKRLLAKQTVAIAMYKQKNGIETLEEAEKLYNEEQQELKNAKKNKGVVNNLKPKKVKKIIKKRKAKITDTRKGSKPTKPSITNSVEYSEATVDAYGNKINIKGPVFTTYRQAAVIGYEIKKEDESTIRTTGYIYKLEYDDPNSNDSVEHRVKHGQDILAKGETVMMDPKTEQGVVVASAKIRTFLHGSGYNTLFKTDYITDGIKYNDLNTLMTIDKKRGFTLKKYQIRTNTKRLSAKKLMEFMDKTSKKPFMEKTNGNNVTSLFTADLNQIKDLI